MPIQAPLLNQWIYDGKGTFVARVDFLWPELGVVGEFDGEGKYASAVHKLVMAEKNRANRLRDLGWLIVNWDWDDLSSPQVLRERLEDAFARAARFGAPGGTYSANRLP